MGHRGSGSRRRPLTSRGEGTYGRLLSSAEEVFSERGYYETSVSEICRRAGVANGTFYQYFDNKEGVFLKLIEQLEEGLSARIRQALTFPGSAEARLLSGYRAILEFIEEHAELYQVFREAEFVRLEIPRRFYADIAVIIQEMLQAGIEVGEFCPLDPEVVAYSLLGIAEFTAMRYIIWEPKALSEETFQSTAELILHGLDTGKPRSSREPPAALDRVKKGRSGVSLEPKGGEATRQALLAAAERMFGQTGFHQTTVSEITYVAGVAQGTFYLYFPSKVAIFTELVREINRQFRAEERAAIDHLTDRREVEREGFAAFFRFISRHREAYRIVREAEFIDEGIGRWYYQRLAQGYVRGLKEGMERGEIRDLPAEPLAYALLGIGHFVGLRWIIWEGREAIPQAALDGMLDFIMHGVSASPVIDS